MAITLNTQPPLFHPLNAAIYKVSSTRPTIQSFRVQVLDTATLSLIATQLFATLPMSPQSSTFDIAALLSSVVDYEISTSPAIESVLAKGVKDYTIYIVEFYLDSSGNRVIGDMVSAQKFVFNAMLSRPDFAAYEIDKYVMMQGNANARFLSNRPVLSSVYLPSTINLYFLSNEASNVRIRFYIRPGTLIGEHLIPFNDANLHSINVSPNAMQAYFGDEIFSLLGFEFDEVFTEEFGTFYSIVNASYYTVQVLTPSNEPGGELRTFQLKTYDCRKKMIELVFTNNLGGLDSMMFLEPKQTVSANKTTIETNPWQLDSSGNYYNYTPGLYNDNEKTVGSKITNSFSLFSEPLNDQSADYARSLVESENVYVRLSDGKLLPVQIVANDYQVFKRKYSTENNRLSVTFRVNDVNFSL